MYNVTPAFSISFLFLVFLIICMVFLIICMAFLISCMVFLIIIRFF